jgi:hypothetical protein
MRSHKVLYCTEYFVSSRYSRTPQISRLHAARLRNLSSTQFVEKSSKRQKTKEMKLKETWPFSFPHPAILE